MFLYRDAAFDKIAVEYDALWSEASIGKAQRSAVWRRIDPLFNKGDFVLDLGCGTGVDAFHLHSRLDGVISNFGALNCLSSLTSLAGSLARDERLSYAPIIRPFADHRLYIFQRL